jgi:aminomethyltransferase
MRAAPEILRRTALYNEHVALGGRLVPFGGFEMPVQYAGILKEHDAVRHRAGLFDLSHMAQFELFGDGVAEWADSLTTNAVGTMKRFQARYNIFTNERGGCHDDVLFYRLWEPATCSQGAAVEWWLLVVNAGNAAKMWAYLNERRRGDVRLKNLHGERALIAIQGPKAAEIIARLSGVEDGSVGALRYYFCEQGYVAGVRAIIARTGYTGEDGFELFVDGADAARLWRSLLETGRPFGLEPCGLGARDMLRLEAGMPLYGFELSEELSPLAGGQGWAVKMNKPAFVGKDELAAQLAADDYDRIAGFVLEGRVPARTGYPVFSGGDRVGEVRSASIAPSYGNRNVGTALLPKAATAVGTPLEIEIRGAHHAAQVVPLPFYKRDG